MEAHVTLTGRHDVVGIWTLFWLIGDILRHTYVGSSEHVWPFSATECTDYTEGTQLIIGCNKVQHYGLTPGVGRGDTELDIFEIQLGGEKSNTGSFLEICFGQPFMPDLYQVATGITYNRTGQGEWTGTRHAKYQSPK